MSVRRIALLRLIVMAALTVCAVMIADHVHPGRVFCPLDGGCDRAQESALGSIHGIPTSVLGVVAFGGFFFLTLLPVEWARRLLRPAGLFAAVAGVGFAVYQDRVLGSFCPLCLVADGAGLVAGIVALTWPRLPLLLSGRRLPGESGASRVAWTLAVILATVAPFAWPRPQEPTWVEIAPLTGLDVEPPPGIEFVPEIDGPDLHAGTAPSVARLPQHTPSSTVPQPTAWSHPETPVAKDVPAAEPSPPSPAAPVADPPPTPSLKPGLSPEPTPSPEPGPARTVPPRATPVIVEYVNAYCTHCRSTHHRLDKVLAEMNVSVRRQRVYTWGSNDYPLWARACAFAQTVGLEERLFEELTRARGRRPSDVYVAARRAGVNTRALQRALQDPTPPPRLVRDREWVRSARLECLPTLDIGRRRLMGEQSEDDLREAVQASLGAAPR